MLVCEEKEGISTMSRVPGPLEEPVAEMVQVKRTLDIRDGPQDAEVGGLKARGR